MVKAIVLYEQEPPADRYVQHVEEFVRPVSCKAFRHGKVFGAPIGDKRYAYFGEFEWDDMESFEEAASSQAFADSAKDAMAMNIPFHVYFVSTE